MAAGLSVGLSCLAGKFCPPVVLQVPDIDTVFFFLSPLAGIAIGITGDAGVRATAQQPRMFVGMVSERDA